jgi:Tol biopolymer transport system component
VAIKLLPAAFTDDPERLARFEREAKVLASLNHPHIAAIHSLHEAEGVRFLSLELVDGEDLAQRLTRGALPVDEAVERALQIAQALEIAHEQGVIHRDLKPANVKVASDGTVKVLDFGLAKAMEPAGLSGSSPTMLPTITSAGSVAGALLGTAAYMSPEQARGQALDRRSDVWSFGCVLYEMLTGKAAFGGNTITDVLAAIVHKEPDWSALPPATPAGVRNVLERCLRKDARERLRDMGDVGLMLREPMVVSPTADAPVAARRRKFLWPVAAAAAVLIVLLVLAGWQIGRSGSRAQVTEPIHVDLAPPEGTRYDLHHGHMVVSPDGRSVAFIAQDAEGRRHLWVRDLREPSARRLDGTEGVRMPFWSPDGEHLGFGARSGLMRVPAGGGPVDTVTAGSLDITQMRSAAWTGAGEILVGMAGPARGLYKVLASGGIPEAVPGLDAQAVGWDYQSSPYPVPGTDAVLMTQRSGQGNTVVIKDGDTPPRELMPGDYNVAYVDPGDILYWRDGGLRARPFDKKTLQLTGEPRLIVAGVAVDPSHLVAHFSVSGGTLAYIQGAEADSQSRLVLRNRAGEEIGSVGPPGNYYWPRFSPDGRRVAVDNSGNANNGDIWIHDLDRPVGTRVSRDPANESAPVWSPDGKQIVFWSLVQGSGDLFIHRVGDSAAPVYMMGEAELDEFPADWSADGRTIALVRGLNEIWLYDLDSGELRPVQPGAAEQTQPTFSPDGKFLAYTSRETGRAEVFLRELTTDGRAWQVSLEGGDSPRWRADGRELFFHGSDGFLHAVDVALGDDVTLGRPTLLFRARTRLEDGWYHYDVAPDGQSFVINSWIEEEAPRAMSLVLNWSP